MSQSPITKKTRTKIKIEDLDTQNPKNNMTIEKLTKLVMEYSREI